MLKPSVVAFSRKVPTCALFILLASLIVAIPCEAKLGGIRRQAPHEEGGAKGKKQSVVERALQTSTTVYGELVCNANAIPSIESADCMNNAVPFSDILSSSSSGSPVVIPCGACVTVDYTDGSTITFSQLDIVGRLHFPPTANLILNTTAVIVQGMLSIGQPATGNTVKLNLYGTDDQYVYPHELCGGSYDESCVERKSIGKKPVAVVGGKLNIQAVDPTCPSWTKLKAASGDVAGETRHFHVDSTFAACLHVGDEIVITSDELSHTKDSAGVIESITNPGGGNSDAVITVEGSFTRTFATQAGPGEPEYAAEVAGLTRNVIFEAQKDDPNAMHGGHMIIFHTPDVIQTITGALFDNFGQDGNIGRYPIHFHESQNTPSTVSKNVVRNSNQRCIVIHNTDMVTVDDNVAYDYKGHCFSTETGNEVLNIFSHNLGARGKKLDVGFDGQSDKPGFAGHHQAATFWIRNMMNTVVDNVAAGTNSIGFWLELKNINSDQLSSTSFHGNVAHSAFTGLLTYKKGWKPVTPGQLVNCKFYKNDEGMKFHISGNFAIKNSLIADNIIGVRYGVWNEGVTLEDTLFVANTNDAKVRLGKSCPITTIGIRPTFNAFPGPFDGFHLKNVTFSDFTCGKKTIQPYYDNRDDSRGMGATHTAVDVAIINSNENSKPTFGCGLEYSTNVFMEDINGTLGPNGKGPGFIIRDNNRMKAFVPQGQCETMPYGGGCNAFCENVCLRLVKIDPSNTAASSLVLSNGVTTFTFPTNPFGGAFNPVLPSGSYHGYFLDDNGVEVLSRSVEVQTFQEPLCSDYVTESSFTFNTMMPSMSPSVAPSISAAPTVTPNEVVKFRSTLYQRFIFAKPGDNGSKGVRLSEDPVDEITITLVRHDNCGNNPYKDLTGVQCVKLAVVGANNRRFYAKKDRTWSNGISTVSQGSTVFADQLWHLEDAVCPSGYADPNAVCVYIRNALSGRSFYDNGSKFGGSPAGDSTTYPYIMNDQYKWEKIPVYV